MDDLPRKQLKLIITRYGVSLYDDPKRCEALLRDFCGQYRQEISLLINAQKEKIPSELLNSQNSSLPVNLTIDRLSKRLEDNLAITSEAAKWSVESWALALNLITEAEMIEEKTASSDQVPSESDNKTKARSLSPPPTVKTQYRRETFQQQQKSPINQNRNYTKEQTDKNHLKNMNLTQLFFAILLPPVGVYLSVGLSSALIINLLLTFLGWLPGIIHALWIITKESERSNV